MPQISQLAKIIKTYMYRGAGGKHHEAHVRAKDYLSDISVTITDNPKVLAGRISSSKMKKLLAWIVLRRDILEKNWKSMNSISGAASHVKVAP